MEGIFRVQNATRVIGGIGLLPHIGKEVERLGVHRCLLVTDRGVHAAGLLEPVARALGSVVVTTFADCVANAETGTVTALAQLVRETGADGLIAVGGGSVMDTAKAANLLVTMGGDEVLNHTRARPSGLHLKLVCIPTTAGTGSEVSIGAVIRDPARGVKVPFGGAFLVPDMALLLPEMTTGLPPGLTAATGYDAFTHAVEAYVSTRHNPFADGLALHAARMITRALPAVMERPGDLEARSQMLYAAAMAAQAFNSAQLGACHAIAHALGGLHSVPHGIANALMLPAVMEYNRPACPERFADLAAAMGAADAVAAAADLRRQLALPERLNQVGVSLTAGLISQAMADPFLPFNPRTLTAGDLGALLESVR